MSLSDDMQKRIYEAVEKTPGAKKLSEAAFLKVATEALDCVKDGYEMRLDEIDDYYR